MDDRSIWHHSESMCAAVSFDKMCWGKPHVLSHLTSSSDSNINILSFPHSQRIKNTELFSSPSPANGNMYTIIYLKQQGLLWAAITLTLVFHSILEHTAGFHFSSTTFRQLDRSAKFLSIIEVQLLIVIVCHYLCLELDLSGQASLNKVNIHTVF